MRVLVTVLGVLSFLVGLALTLLPYLVRGVASPPPWLILILCGLGGLIVFPDVVQKAATIAKGFLPWGAGKAAP